MWWLLRPLLLALLIFTTSILAQDYNADDVKAPPPAQESCNGIFLTYSFVERNKEYPHVKNASAQAWAFKSTATVLNTMTTDLKAWKLFIGFQHHEILVSASGAVVTDGTDFPVSVVNGTTLAGYPMADLLNSIDTAGDMTQIMVQIDMTGTQFGVKPPGVPMPKTIKLMNDGFKCPKPTKKIQDMYVCCVRDPKFKIKKSASTRYLPRQYGDLTIAYDILQSYGSSYLAQVTLDNLNPLGRLDSWNLTWEWKRGEFINSMRGAYTLEKEYSECIYGQAGTYYQSLDFAQVMNCQKKPIIVDLPAEKAKDEKIANLPFCCKNGTLLPPTMDPSKSTAMFQLEVYKLPPDLNRTALYPPQNFHIDGKLNPEYVCGPPIRVAPQVFPDSNGLLDHSYAVASWQVACNISRPKRQKSRCCVSFSAYYNTSVVPCNTCACGCPDDEGCDPDAVPLLLPSEALLIPFENRTAKAKAWAHIKHRDVPNPLPCGDNCGVSINWHIFSDYRKGWTARITLFNWADDYTFKDWFAAVRFDEQAYKGYQNVYSFNGTKMAEINNTVFFQGLPGLTYLMPEVPGADPLHDMRVPGKQQSVISFDKKDTPGINIERGDGFPSRIYFNGEECSLPDGIPIGDGHKSRVSLLTLFLTVIIVFATINHQL